MLCVDRTLKQEQYEIKVCSVLEKKNSVSFESAMYILFLLRHNISEICTR
jgi:hypothetical protein